MGRPIHGCVLLSWHTEWHGDVLIGGNVARVSVWAGILHHLLMVKESIFLDLSRSTAVELRSTYNAVALPAIGRVESNLGGVVLATVMLGLVVDIWEFPLHANERLGWCVILTPEQLRSITLILAHYR